MTDLTVFELAPAADELWEMDHDPRSGYLSASRDEVAFPSVASGAKLRPRVTAYYASGKATNIARVLEAFLQPAAAGDLARMTREGVRCRLTTCLPGQPGGYAHPELLGPTLSRFTPGAAYMACLQARDFSHVQLGFVDLPASDETQVDRRCANLFGRGGGELINFSPYLYWSAGSVAAALAGLRTAPRSEFIGLAGSLPLVDGQTAPDLYARAISHLREASPGAVISLDVGGAPLRACLEAPAEARPDFLCINTDEYLGVPQEVWGQFAGTAVVHDKHGAWVLREHALDPGPVGRPPDVPVPQGVQVVHTICAGDASHGGLILGLMLYGTAPEGVLRAACLSQACGLTVVESHDSIRGLTAERVQQNLARLRPTPWGDQGQKA